MTGWLSEWGGTTNKPSTKLRTGCAGGLEIQGTRKKKNNKGPCKQTLG